MKVYIAPIKDKDRKFFSDQMLVYAYNDLVGENIDIRKIYKNKYGKPYYDNTFYYNISHSKNYIVLAVDEAEVGIDIEEPRFINPDLSERILAKNEKLLDGDILNNWVLKEAYAKYLGVGLYLDFRSFSTETILKSENVVNLSSEDYYCFLISKNPARVKVTWLDTRDLFS